MAKFAVTLAGVPAPTNSNVVNELRNRFSEGYVFQSRAARASRDSTAVYSAGGVEAALEAATHAVFGTNKRPSGFCRNHERTCALKGGKGKTCEKGEADGCYQERPEFLVIFFQDGRDELSLIQKLHFCAQLVKIPKGCYGNQRKTVDFVANSIRSVKAAMERLRREMSSRNSPILLPPINFQGAAILRLLNSACFGEFNIEKFRSECFEKGTHSYLARRKTLAFKPAEDLHGGVGPQGRADLALSRYHRVGCTYPGEWHYDVTRVDGRDFDGSIKFHCRMQGDVWPRGPRVNVLVDDCLR